MQISSLAKKQGVTRAGEPRGKGPSVATWWNGRGAGERQDPEDGQALIMLLFFVLVGMIITTAAIFIIIQNSLSAGREQMGVITRQMADTGVENALLQVLRGNCATENLTLPDGDITVDLSLSGVDCSSITKITSTAKASDYIKVVEVNVSYDNNELKIDSWKEIN